MDAGGVVPAPGLCAGPQADAKVELQREVDKEADDLELFHLLGDLSDEVATSPSVGTARHVQAHQCCHCTCELQLVNCELKQQACQGRRHRTAMDIALDSFHHTPCSHLHLEDKPAHVWLLSLEISGVEPCMVLQPN